MGPKYTLTQHNWTENVFAAVNFRGQKRALYFNFSIAKLDNVARRMQCWNQLICLFGDCVIYREVTNYSNVFPPFNIILTAYLNGESYEKWSLTQTHIIRVSWAHNDITCYQRNSTSLQKVLTNTGAFIVRLICLGKFMLHTKCLMLIVCQDS